MALNSLNDDSLDEEDWEAFIVVVLHLLLIPKELNLNLYYPRELLLLTLHQSIKLVEPPTKMIKFEDANLLNDHFLTYVFEELRFNTGMSSLRHHCKSSTNPVILDNECVKKLKITRFPININNSDNFSGTIDCN